MQDYESCPVCHKPLPENLEANFCPYCGVSFIDGSTPEPPVSHAFPPAPPIPEPDEPDTPKGIPWESATHLSFLQRLTQTWAESVFRTTDFFKKMPIRGGSSKALVYALIFQMMGQAFSIFWQKWFIQTYHDTINEIFPSFQEFFNTSVGDQLIMAPLFALLILILSTVIYHVSLLLVGSGQNGFEGTFRVVAYSQGTMVMNVVPLFGGLLAWIWGLVLMANGFSEVHRISSRRAVVAILLPLIFCCVVPLIFFVSMGSFFMNLGQTGF